MATRIGVDLGGTFTDLICYDDASGRVLLAKEPTTPDAPERGTLAAIASAVSDQIADAEYFLHGMTVGLNALLERRGAVVGLLCTRGFRDVLEIRRGDREEMYNLFWKQPPELVPRHLRLPVSERIRADGEVETPLDPADVAAALEDFLAAGVECVAVAFINAYASNVHELEAERLLREHGFEGEISLSHRISGEYREYERTCTTVVDAYVRPRTSRYLRRLASELGAIGFSGSLLVTRSGGGAMSFSEAERRPFETIQSGPVAGAEGAAELARQFGLGDLISADVGGTSFDTCLISDGRPQMMYEGKVEGLPVQTPWVDVRSIGAGGGSIAHIDAGGLLKVGPRSAGADPGPACYSRGGVEPTATDAAATLGMLGEGRLASGIVLDLDRAWTALATIAVPLHFDVEEAAQGVVRILTATMADAIRNITIERGADPRRMKLMPFGGAGSLFGVLLARELGIAEVVVPPHAGNFSAWGLLGADLTQTAALTRIMTLSDTALEAAHESLDAMFAELQTRGDDGHSRHESVRELSLDMRYSGQEYTLAIPVELDDQGQIASTSTAIAERFTAEYERAFAHSLDGEVEIVNLRATVRTALPRRATESRPTGSGRSIEDAPIHRAHSFRDGERIPFKILDRHDLPVGEQIASPAIVLEPTTTTYVDTGFRISVDDASGCMILTDDDAAA